MDPSCRHRCMSTTAVSSKEEMDNQAPETDFLWSLLRIMGEISWIEWNMFLWGRSCERRGIIWCCRLDADPAASLRDVAVSRKDLFSFLEPWAAREHCIFLC